jgi:hypothetical protein
VAQLLKMFPFIVIPPKEQMQAQLTDIALAVSVAFVPQNIAKTNEPVACSTNLTLLISRVKKHNL